MIDKKMRYKSEIYNIYGVINLIVLICFIGFLMYIGEVSIGIVIVVIIILSSIIAIFEYIRKSINERTYQDFVRESDCICAPATIYKQFKKLYGKSSGFTKTRYYVIVEYYDPYTKELNKYTTPALSFNPEKELGSFKCNIYIKDDQKYVTDFIRRGIDQENIWHPGQEYLKKERAKDKLNKSIVSILILAIIIIIISIVLSIKKAGL